MVSFSSSDPGSSSGAGVNYKDLVLHRSSSRAVRPAIVSHQTTVLLHMATRVSEKANVASRLASFFLVSFFPLTHLFFIDI